MVVNGSYGCDVMVAIFEDAIMFKSALLNNKISLKERKAAKMGKTFKIFCAELKEQFEQRLLSDCVSVYFNFDWKIFYLQQLLDTPKTLINYMYLYI